MKSVINLLEQFAAQAHHFTFVYSYKEKAFVYVSAPLSQLLGENAAENIKDPKQLLALIRADDHELVLETVEKLKNGRAYVDIKFRLIAVGLQLKWLQLKASLLEEKTNLALTSWLGSPRT